MAKNLRQQQIIDEVRKQGFVSVEVLVKHFGVTAQTIRRDMNALCEEGLLRRYHGGATLPTSVENVAYDTRKTLWHNEKEAIAAMVADYIPDHASVFINIGTTSEEVAKMLCEHKRLRVITNNLNVASVMGAQEEFEVIVTGGMVRARDLGITGEATIDIVSQFKVDYGIIGISSIEEDGTLRDFDYHEVRVTQSIMKQSREVLLVADHSKFGRNALVRLGHLSQIHTLFTDKPLPPSMDRVIADAGVQVLISGQDIPIRHPTRLEYKRN